MKAENVVKSIIYGNSFVNSYGLFRALCAAVSEKEHIDKIIFYLRAAENFRKFNKYIYAFRIEEANPVFMTETNKSTKNFLEGFNEDVTLEGNGQKLLHLIQKFNVKNVMVIVAIAQKDPLHEFNSEHHMTVIRSAKDLLNSLYQKVAKSEEVQTSPAEKQPICRKLYILPDLYDPPRYRDIKIRQNNRPNYVGLVVPDSQKPKKELRRVFELRYLNAKIKDLAYELQVLLNQLGEEENASLRFMLQYDQSQEVQKVIKLLNALFGSEAKQAYVKTNISSLLRNVSIRTLSNKTIDSLNLMLLGDPQMKSSKVTPYNKLLGTVVNFIETLMKSYSFAKKIAILETTHEMEGLPSSNRKPKSKSSITRKSMYSNY